MVKIIEANMKKWEYLYAAAVADRIMIINNKYITTNEDLFTYLNKMGYEGWELVGMTNDAPSNDHNTYIKLIFKRPLT